MYGATAFVLLQAAQLLADGLAFPDWFFPAITVVLILGLPVALILAWALELTPDGVRVTTESALSHTTGPPPSLLGKWTVAVAALLMILGIGFGAGWFLWPVSSPGLLDADPTAPTTPSNRSIAVLPFVNMSDEAANEFFADGISEELLNVLVRVEGIGVASRTSSFAYKGRDLGTVVIARELNVAHVLEGSVRKDGERVRINAQLIDALNHRHLWSETYDRELTDIFAVQEEIANAISAVMESWDFVDRDYNALAQQAIDADPNNATIHLWRSISWVQLGFFDRALADQDRCLAIDPAYQNCLRWKAITLQLKGDTDLALDLLEQNVAGDYLGSRGLIFIEPFLRRGNRVAALLVMQGLGWPRELQETVIHTRLDGGTPADPQALVARTAPDDGRSHTQLYMLLGAYDLALATEFPYNLVEFWDPSHTGLRQTPAFAQFLDRLGVPAYWREHGFPPQCRPLRGSDFECVF